MYFYICRVSDALVRQLYGDAFVMLGYVIKTKVNEVTKRSMFSAKIDCPGKAEYVVLRMELILLLLQMYP